MKTVSLLFHSVCAILLMLGPKLADAANIGVVYGSQVSGIPPPAKSVLLYEVYKIGRMYMPNDPQQPILYALQNTTVQLAVAVNNVHIPRLASGIHAAVHWLRVHFQPHLDRVNFRYIVVGRDAVLAGGVAAEGLPSAMANIHAAMSRFGGAFRYTKVTTAVSDKVLGIKFPPSRGQFVTAYMGPVIKFLAAHDAPLMAAVQPYFEYITQNGGVPLGYALFSSANQKLVDGKLIYNNLFDQMVDAFYSALERAGAPNVRVAVAETGWPSGGGKHASLDNAETFNWKLIEHVLSTKGTPKRPGSQIETYIYSLFNEDQLRGDEAMRNFGLFSAYNMQPVYGFPELQ